MKYSNKYQASTIQGRVFYCPETGAFFNQNGSQKVLRMDHRGYMRVNITGAGALLAHRVAWMLVHGSIPKSHIDHIDSDKTNNRINNLRVCTHNQNQHNQGIRKNNKSGFKGVSWMKSNRKWHAQICCNSKVKHLGFYDEKEDAARAYDKAAIEIHGEFAWTNFG